MTKRTLAAGLLVLLAALPMRAGFHDVAHAIGRRPGIHRVTIPLLGLIRFGVWIVHPKGVYDFQLATFEGHGGGDAEELAAVFRERIGPEYRPLVQVRSSKSGELTMIYAKPLGGDRVDLFILTRDRQDTVLLRVDADATVAAAEVRKQGVDVRGHRRH